MTIEQWLEKIGNLQYKRVAATYLGSGKDAPWVSTVWLGVDHAFRLPGEEGPILIFETMVFRLPAFEGDQWWYTTEEQALAGHTEIVALAKIALDVAQPGGVDEPIREEEQHHD